jgi:hypothetical protein
MVSGDQSADPVVAQAAKIMRERVFEPIRKRHVENGNFSEEMATRNAISYFPLVHDADAVRANREAWIEHHENAFLRELKEEMRQAKVEKGARASDKEDMQLAAGKAAEEDFKTIDAEHEQNIGGLRTARAEQMAEAETRAKEDLATLKEKHDNYLADLRETRDEMLAGEHPEGKAKDSKARINAQYNRAKTTAEKKYIRDQNRLNRKDQMARDKITKKFDKQEEKARKARDDAKQSAMDEAGKTVQKAKQLDLTEGLSILRFARTNAVDEETLLAKEAARRASSMFETITGTARFTNDHDIGIGAAGYGKFRSNPAWHADLIQKGWVKTDVLDIAEHYTRTAGTDAAIGTIFKKTVQTVDEETGSKVTKEIGDIKLENVRKAIEDEYKNALSSAKTAEEQVAFKNRAVRALENVDMMVKFSKGQPWNSNSSQSFATAAELVGAFNFLRLMGGTVASSLGDPINIVMANGWGRTMRHGILPMLKNFKEAVGKMDADQVRLARLTNANVEVTMNSTVMALAEMGNPFAKATPMVTFARNASKVFSKATGITYWNHLWKQIAFNTTTARIVENARTGWSGLSKAERAFMLNVGINEASLARIGTSFEGQAGSKFVDGTDLPIARFDEWADKEAGSLLRAAANQQSHSQVITPHWSDKMALSGNPMGVLIMQFRNFMFANQARIIGRNIQLAALDDGVGKRASVASAMFGLAMMGAVVDATKHMLGNTTISGGSLDMDHSSFDRVLREWEKTPATALYNALDRTGMFGVVFEGSNMLEKLGLPNIRGTASYLAGDDTGGRRESARFAQRGMFESVLGPTFGLAEDVVRAGSMLTGMADSYIGSGEAPNFNRSDFRKIKRLLPFQNAPGVQQLINEYEAHVGTVFDWPDPK